MFKKLNKQIQASRYYTIPSEIMHHFIIFRDSVEQSQYGIVHLDFDNEEIVYEGPVYSGVSPITALNPQDKENHYSAAIKHSQIDDAAFCSRPEPQRDWSRLDGSFGKGK